MNHQLIIFFFSQNNQSPVTISITYLLEQISICQNEQAARLHARREQLATVLYPSGIATPCVPDWFGVVHLPLHLHGRGLCSLKLG